MAKKERTYVVAVSERSQTEAERAFLAFTVSHNRKPLLILRWTWDGTTEGLEVKSDNQDHPALPGGYSPFELGLHVWEHYVRGADIADYPDESFEFAL